MRAFTASFVAAAIAIAPVAGCAFAVKNPAPTAAIIGATLGFGTCEIGTDFESHGTCAIVGGSAAALLGLVTFAALAFGGDGNTVLQSSEPTEAQQKPVPRDPTLDQPPADPDAPPPSTTTPPEGAAPPPATTPAPASPTP